MGRAYEARVEFLGAFPSESIIASCNAEKLPVQVVILVNILRKRRFLRKWCDPDGSIARQNIGISSSIAPHPRGDLI